MNATEASPTLTLDDNHIYRLDCVKIPGVTQVLTDVGLLSIEWVTPEALYRGRYVHQVLHYLNEGDYDLADCLPEFRGYVESWIKFRDRLDLRLRIIESEKR